MVRAAKGEGNNNCGKLYVLEGDNFMTKKKDIVQVKNPKTDRYVKVNRTEGQIVSHKKSPGPYKNVPVARKSSGGKKK
jgi:hypothetical protein